MQAAKKNAHEVSESEEDSSGSNPVPSMSVAHTQDVRGKKIFISGNSNSINYKKIESLATTSYGCILEKRLHKGIDYFIVGSEAGEELDEAEKLGMYYLKRIENIEVNSLVTVSWPMVR